MQETKPFWQSTGFWGIVVTLVANLLAKKGYKINEQLANDTIQVILNIIGLVVGPIMALVGRWKAVKPLSITGVPKIAPLMIVGMLIFVGGCGSSTNAKQVTLDGQLSLINYRSNMETLTNKMIENYRLTQLEMADTLASEALASVKKPDGTANVSTIQAIMNKHLEDYAAINQKVAGMQAMVVQASKDGENAAKAFEGLLNYWNNSTNNAKVLQQSTVAAVDLIQEYLNRSKKTPKP